MFVDLLALKDGPLPSHPCVLPRGICKSMSADMFLKCLGMVNTITSRKLWGGQFVCMWDSKNKGSLSLFGCNQRTTAEATPHRWHHHDSICFWMQASSWTSLHLLLHFGRAANGLVRAGRDANPFRVNIGITGTPAILRFYRTTHGYRLGSAVWLYEIPAEGLREAKRRREHEEAEKVRVRGRPRSGYKPVGPV
jgi:hypothetical protein